MAIELPGWLVTAFYVVGLPWPGIDEDELRSWATSVRRFADGITSTSGQTQATMSELAEGSDAGFTDALAARWERRSRLVADLRGPLGDFADGLDGAAHVVEAQKLACITALGILAGELTEDAVGAFFTLGLNALAAIPEVLTTREAIKLALEYVEAEIMGYVINGVATDVADHLSSFLTTFLDDALPVAMEVQSLRVSYSALRGAASSMDGQAAEAEETGQAAYGANADRDITDDSPDGGFAAVVTALEAALYRICVLLFRDLPAMLVGAIRDDATSLRTAITALQDTDETAAQDITDPEGAPAPQVTAVVTAPVGDGTPADTTPPVTPPPEPPGGGAPPVGGGGGDDDNGGPPGDPAFEYGPMGDDFQPGVYNPEVLQPNEVSIARYLADEHGVMFHGRLEDHTVGGLKNPEGMARWTPDDEGKVTEFKTLESPKNDALKREIKRAADQVVDKDNDTQTIARDGEAVIDGRNVGTTADDVNRVMKRLRGTGDTVPRRTYVILGDGRMVYFDRDGGPVTPMETPDNG